MMHLSAYQLFVVLCHVVAGLRCKFNEKGLEEEKSDLQGAIYECSHEITLNTRKEKLCFVFLKKDEWLVFL